MHGFDALVLTVDAPRGRPPRARPAHRVLRPAGIDMPGRVRRRRRGSEGITPAGFFSLMDTTITWRELEQLVEENPISPCSSRGCSTGTTPSGPSSWRHGVVVSNHGGRQLDKCPRRSTCCQPSSTRWATGGGHRRRWHPPRHRCAQGARLGAQAVLVGRPALWGLAPSAARPGRCGCSSSCARRSSLGSRSSEHRRPQRDRRPPRLTGGGRGPGSAGVYSLDVVGGYFCGDRLALELHRRRQLVAAGLPVAVGRS